MSSYYFDKIVKFHFVSQYRTCNVGHKTFDLWHFKLRHASFKRINVISQQFSNIKCSNYLFCEFCPLGKQRKVHFPANVKCTKNAFELIHIDIWGLYEEPTLLNQKCFSQL